jgi:hypothetical protein
MKTKIWFIAIWNLGFIVCLVSIANAGQLVYSTFLGRSDIEKGYAIAVDSVGNVYVTGLTFSNDFSISNVTYDTTSNGNCDVFVTKLNSTGTTLVYSTYLGGSGDDIGTVIAIDNFGNAYISGYTSSTNFPTTPSAFDTSFNLNTTGIYPDVFVTKLNSSGSALVYSTYLGGIGDDACYGIVVDNTGNAYITGITTFSDFPTTAGAYDTTHNDFYDVFVSKLNSTGTALVYSTYFGGSRNDYGSGIQVDSAGNVFITGETDSFNLPTTAGAFSTEYNGGYYDAYVTKINTSGTALVYSTYLGGSAQDVSLGIAVDIEGNAYITGGTEYSDFPTTPGAFNTIGGNGFVSKLNTFGTALVYSSYLKGVGYNLVLDNLNNAYITGFTFVSDFPTTPGAFDTTYHGNTDGFVIKVNNAGSALLYSTYLGGSNQDLGICIALDTSGYAYITGYTSSSTDFPITYSAFDTTYNGGSYDAFVCKLNLERPTLIEPDFWKLYDKEEIIKP